MKPHVVVDESNVWDGPRTPLGIALLNRVSILANRRITAAELWFDR